MEIGIQIEAVRSGGTEFLAKPGRLHLGGMGAEQVDRLCFLLPEEWQGKEVTLYTEWRDGTTQAPTILDSDGCAAVTRRFTGSTAGRWMLTAIGENGYKAYTRPAAYDCHDVLSTEAESEEISPTLYEQFVNRVLSNAQAAVNAEKKATAASTSAAQDAQQAQNAAAGAEQARSTSENAAERAQAAAERAEGVAPEDGRVTSVNGQGGIVVLGAQDVGAVPMPEQPKAGALLRILSVDAQTGVMTVEAVSAEEAGCVKVSSQYGIQKREDGTLETVAAETGQIDALTDLYAPIVPGNLKYGVKKAMTDAGGWTGEQQQAACGNLGAMRTAGGTFTGTVAFGSESYTIDTEGNAKFKAVTGAVYND